MLSVLLPYRDAEATLRDALESILEEPEVDELVAMNDGSRDDSAAVARSVQDARIIHRETPGIGVAKALSASLAFARGDIIGRMDADDVSLPGRFAAELDLLRSDSKLGAVGCQVDVFGDADGMRAYVAWQNSLVTIEEHARDVFVESPLCHPSTIIRRSILESVGGFRDAPWAEDYDLWLRMNAAGFGLAKVPRILFRWRCQAGRVTLRDGRCSLERMREARATYLAPRLAALGKPLCVWGAGPTGKRLARELERFGHHARSFIDVDPRKIGHVRRGAPVLAPTELPISHTIVVAVGAAGARDLIRSDLRTRGLTEGVHFICAA